MLPTLVLKPPAVQRLRQGHPWVFYNQVTTFPPDITPGDLALLTDDHGRVQGFGYVNPRTVLAVRVLYAPEAAKRGGGVPDEKLEIQRKLDRARSRRRQLHLDSNGVRLVWAEADGLPGLVCDQYADLIAVQFLTAGMESRRALVLDWLISRLKPSGIFERSEGPARQREGLEPRTGWAWFPGAAPPDSAVIIQEGPLRFQVDLARGQKTGFYLDQRAARRQLWQSSIRGSVMDTFAYTGGFSLAAVSAGADRVLAVERSADALAQLAANARLNQAQDRITAVRADAFGYLRQAAGRRERYTGVILDPPPFARNRLQHAGAERGHLELHRQASRLVEPGGWLLSCSCSHAFGPQDLKRSILTGAQAAGRRIKKTMVFGPDADHFEKVQVPESRYLSCLMAQFD